MLWEQLQADKTTLQGFQWGHLLKGVTLLPLAQTFKVTKGAPRMILAQAANAAAVSAEVEHRPLDRCVRKTEKQTD